MDIKKKAGKERERGMQGAGKKNEMAAGSRVGKRQHKIDNRTKRGCGGRRRGES